MREVEEHRRRLVLKEAKEMEEAKVENLLEKQAQVRRRHCNDGLC